MKHSEVVVNYNFKKWKKYKIINKNIMNEGKIVSLKIREKSC